MNNPLSFKNLLSGLIVTVVGGIILVLILKLPTIFDKDSKATPEPTGTAQQVIITVIATSPTLTEVPVCMGAPDKRLSVGENAIICTKSDPVRLRTDPKHTANSIDNLPPGVIISVIGGPVCDEPMSAWYWEVSTDNGYTGWVSEGGDAVDAYYVCPVE
jgi:hypothetical protein